METIDWNSMGFMSPTDWASLAFGLSVLAISLAKDLLKRRK
jgi:hypothetical protein